MSTSGYTYYTYATPHGPATLRASEKGLVEAAFGRVELEGSRRASEMTNRAANELQEYLAGKRYTFDVPLDMQGSAFQKAVWECVCEVPYGQTSTPSDIALTLGKPGAHRSVGTALRANRLAPFVPTHRIEAARAVGRQARIFRALAAFERHVLEASS